MKLTGEQKNKFNEDGYFILEKAIPEEQIQKLSRECDQFIDIKNREMDEQNTDTIGLSHRNSRYFISRRWKESTVLREFVTGPFLVGIARDLLGGNIFLFHEQFVVKCARGGREFGWHQDSGYVPFPHKPYLTCWCALTEVNEENGTISILPFTRVKSRDIIHHQVDKDSNDKVGYRGKDSGIPVNVPAGSIVFFSSRMFHRSSINRSDSARKVYVCQYTCERLELDKQKQYSEPLLIRGEKVLSLANC